MKKLITLILGILIAGTAMCAIPTVIKDTKMKTIQVFKISDDAAVVSATVNSVEIDADVGSVAIPNDTNNTIITPNEDAEDAPVYIDVRWRPSTLNYSIAFSRYHGLNIDPGDIKNAGSRVSMQKT